MKETNVTTVLSESQADFFLWVKDTTPHVAMARVYKQLLLAGWSPTHSVVGCRLQHIEPNRPTCTAVTNTYRLKSFACFAIDPCRVIRSFKPFGIHAYHMYLYWQLLVIDWICLWIVQVVQEYERAVIFRLGRIAPGGAKGPGESAWWQTCSTRRSLIAIKMPRVLVHVPRYSLRVRPSF